MGVVSSSARPVHAVTIPYKRVIFSLKITVLKLTLLQYDLWLLHTD